MHGIVTRAKTGHFLFEATMAWVLAKYRGMQAGMSRAEGFRVLRIFLILLEHGTSSLIIQYFQQFPISTRNILFQHFAKNGLSFSSQSEVSLFAVAKSLSRLYFQNLMLNAGQSKIFANTSHPGTLVVRNSNLCQISKLEGRCYYPL